jgi:hypothetical protein
VLVAREQVAVPVKGDRDRGVAHAAAERLAFIPAAILKAASLARIVGMGIERSDIDVHPLGERQSGEQTVELGLARGTSLR